MINIKPFLSNLFSRFYRFMIDKKIPVAVSVLLCFVLVTYHNCGSSVSGDAGTSSNLASSAPFQLEEAIDDFSTLQMKEMTSPGKLRLEKFEDEISHESPYLADHILILKNYLTDALRANLERIHREITFYSKEPKLICKDGSCPFNGETIKCSTLISSSYDDNYMYKYTYNCQENYIVDADFTVYFRAIDSAIYACSNLNLFYKTLAQSSLNFVNESGYQVFDERTKKYNYMSQFDRLDKLIGGVGCFIGQIDENNNLTNIQKISGYIGDMYKVQGGDLYVPFDKQNYPVQLTSLLINHQVKIIAGDIPEIQRGLGVFDNFKGVVYERFRPGSSYDGTYLLDLRKMISSRVFEGNNLSCPSVSFVNEGNGIYIVNHSDSTRVNFISGKDIHYLPSVACIGRKAATLDWTKLVNGEYSFDVFIVDGDRKTQVKRYSGVSLTQPTIFNFGDVLYLRAFFKDQHSDKIWRLKDSEYLVDEDLPL